MSQMKVSKILFSKQEIANRVRELGKEITKDYDGPIVALGVLKGCVVFFSDIVREIEHDVSLSFMEVSSYADGTVSKGVLTIRKDLDIDIEGKDVLIIEDIMDSGFTLNALRERLLERNPKSLRICTAFDKPSRRTVDITPDYVGFEIPDEFVVGYGLDYAEMYRNLPYLAVVEPVED